MTTAYATDTFALFNPALSAAVIASGAIAHRERVGAGMPIALVFLVVPLAMHAPFRDALPGNVTARIGGWLNARPDVRADFPRVAASYVPIAREGVRAGLRSGALVRDGAALEGVLRGADGLSNEVVSVLGKARLAGRWLGLAGDPAFTYRLFGVRP
jgi:ABC-3C biological conflict system middle component